MIRSIPFDVDGMNDMRAAWAKAAVRTFMQATGCDYQDTLVDLLCDLMHFADREDFDYDVALGQAREHYWAETLDA